MTDEAAELLRRLTTPDELEELAGKGAIGAELAAIHLGMARDEGPLTLRQQALEIWLARQGYKVPW